MEGFDAAFIEIGGAGELTSFNAMAAAEIVIMAMRRYPFADLHLAVSGFDDDPREVWDIPETKEYFEMFVGAMFVLHAPPVSEWRLDQATMGVIAMCCGIGTIVGRDSKTGVYDIRIKDFDSLGAKGGE
jgi:hypothetical protein